MLHSEHARARKVFLKTENIVDLGTPPSVDRLVIVTNTADVRTALRQQAEPKVLRNIGVLIFVHQDELETLMIFRQYVWVVLEQTQAFHQQIAEVGGIHVSGREADVLGRFLESVTCHGGLCGSLQRGEPLGRGGKILGEIEESFIDQLAPGDTFLFAGQILRFEGLNELTALASRSNAEDPQIPAYMGGKFPLSTYLADRVRAMLASPQEWRKLPPQVREWLTMQQIKSVLPKRDQMLVETFPRGHKHYLVC